MGMKQRLQSRKSFDESHQPPIDALKMPALHISSCEVSKDANAAFVLIAAVTEGDDDA